MQGAIGPWMASVGEMEKRSIIRLMRMAHPDQLNIEKPRKTGLAPTCSMGKQEYAAALSSAGFQIMKKSASSPALR